MQQRLISTTSKVACQGRRKVGRIQHPKWRSTKSSWCSYRRPIEVQRQSCHRCVKSGVCFHGTSKCSMGSAQQSAAISKVWPNPKGRKVACQTAAQSHSLGLAKCCRSSRHRVPPRRRKYGSPRMCRNRQVKEPIKVAIGARK